jgi:hypothetical protein
MGWIGFKAAGIAAGENAVRKFTIPLINIFLFPPEIW